MYSPWMRWFLPSGHDLPGLGCWAVAPLACNVPSTPEPAKRVSSERRRRGGGSWLLPAVAVWGSAKQIAGTKQPFFWFFRSYLLYSALHMRQELCCPLHTFAVSRELNFDVETKSTLENGKDVREIIHRGITLWG